MGTSAEQDKLSSSAPYDKVVPLTEKDGNRTQNGKGNETVILLNGELSDLHHEINDQQLQRIKEKNSGSAVDPSKELNAPSKEQAVNFKKEQEAIENSERDRLEKEEKDKMR